MKRMYKYLLTLNILCGMACLPLFALPTAKASFAKIQEKVGALKATIRTFWTHKDYQSTIDPEYTYALRRALAYIGIEEGLYLIKIETFFRQTTAVQHTSKGQPYTIDIYRLPYKIEQNSIYIDPIYFNNLSEHQKELFLHKIAYQYKHNNYKKTVLINRINVGLITLLSVVIQGQCYAGEPYHVDFNHPEIEFGQEEAEEYARQAITEISIFRTNSIL